jgi:hypothetical protein
VKNPKIIIVCVALVVLPVLIESCCGLGNGSCGCGSTEWATAFNIKSMVVSTVNRKGLGSSSSLDPPSPGPLSNFAFSVYMDAEYRQAYLEQSRPTMAAYACSPVDPVGDQKITAISIKSNNVLTTVNGTFAAGQELSSIFFVMVLGGAQPIDDILNKELYYNVMTIITNEKADATQLHTFTITISLDDGRIFDLTTEEGEITPG